MLKVLHGTTDANKEPLFLRVSPWEEVAGKIEQFLNLHSATKKASEQNAIEFSRIGNHAVL